MLQMGQGVMIFHLGLLFYGLAICMLGISKLRTVRRTRWIDAGVALTGLMIALGLGESISVTGLMLLVLLLATEGILRFRFWAARSPHLRAAHWQGAVYNFALISAALVILGRA